MDRFSFFPEGDSRQRHRMQRYLMAVAATAMVLVLFALAWWAGVIGRAALLASVVLAAGFVVLFYAIFRSGLNLRAGDPSLTTPQIAASLIVILLVLAGAGPDHAVLLLILLVSYLFGVLRIGTRDMLLLSAGVSGAYAAILFGGWPQSVPGGDLRLAILNWAVLTAVLLFYSVMGGYISRLRHQLAENRNELEAALQRIEHLVSHDELTGVLNRRRLMEVLEREHARARRYGTPFSVCMVDLDQFKQINDSYGHATGDDVLRVIARAMAAITRDSDVFGRYGGEEFLIVMSATLPEDVAQGAERIRAGVAELRLPGVPPEYRVTASIGIATHRAGESVDATLERADRALYRAKNAGRNRTEAAPA
ncbi:MAG: GGDEF domain-containing protein [Betaproteobacteria bacterium]|nr:GGDEF domain-containing protein [Betaproteobacteria bacterium]